MTTIAARLTVPLGVPAVGGVLLGVLDLQVQRYVPYPGAELANSAAVWALAAFLVGLGFRPILGRAVAAATVVLVVAVAVYYVAAAVLLGDGISVLWSQTGGLWFLAALIAGPVFGGAAALSDPATGRGIRRLAVLVPSIPFLAEAVLDLRRTADPNYDPTEQWQLVVIKTVVGLAVPVVVWVVDARRAKPGEAAPAGRGA